MVQSPARVRVSVCACGMQMYVRAQVQMRCYGIAHEDMLSLHGQTDWHNAAACIHSHMSATESQHSARGLMVADLLVTNHTGPSQQQ